MSRQVKTGARQHHGLSRTWRVVISLLLVIHLLAVFAPPFALMTSGPLGPSPTAEALLQALRPYIDFAYLNHGYAFFAPDPGPSHLVRARLEFADGREPVEERFPDLRRQWPRLLYHRHFMLSEQLNSQFAPPQPPPPVLEDPERLAAWRNARALYELKWKSFENHLRTQYQAANVALTRVEHRLIDVPEVRDRGRRLNDPETFLDLPETGMSGETP